MFLTVEDAFKTDNMEPKFIAIGVAAIVVIAAIGGGVVLLSNSNNDNNNNNNADMPDVTGKWNLAYIEIANLWDESTGKPLAEASSVTITDHHLNPYDPKMTLDIKNTSDHGFKGEIESTDKKVIYGTLDGPSIRFTLEKDEFVYVFEGVAKMGDYLSGSMTKVKGASGEGGDAVVCGITYMMFIKDGAKPVSPRSDYANMLVTKVINDQKPFRAVLHKVSDFEGENKGQGTDSDIRFEFIDTHYMITVFDVKDGDTRIGVQATVTTGVTPYGTVVGKLAGNLVDLAGTGNMVVFGNMVMAHGKISFLHHFHPKDIGHSPEFAEIEYNVPYQKGGNLVPVYINSTVAYKGTSVIKCEGKEDVKQQISRTFTVYDNTFYSTSTVDGKETVWFGEIYGHHIDIYVSSGDHNKLGHLRGHVDLDGSIHIFGILHDYEDGVPSFLDIDISPVKA